MRGRARKNQVVSQLLEFANIFGPNMSPALSYEMPPSRLANNKNIFKEIGQMKATASHLRIGYLTSNQIQGFNRMFILHKNIEVCGRIDNHTSPFFNNPEEYETYINPEIVEGQGLMEMEETCLSIPFIRFHVPRYQSFLLKYRTQNREFREDVFKGIQGQIIQHCISHLNGQILIDYKLSKGKFHVEKQVLQNFQKTNFLLRQYSYRLKDYHSMKNPSKQQQQKSEQIHKEYLERLKYEYERQWTKYSQKLERQKSNQR